MPIFEMISKNAPFPGGYKKGTSFQVMGETIPGDQDDWAVDTLGIPSATAEIGTEF